MSARVKINQVFQRWAELQHPFSAILRWFVVCGAGLRVVLSTIQWKQVQPPVWWVVLLLYGLYAILISAAHLKKPAFRKERWFFVVQLVADTLFCSIYFYLSGNVDSDLYLNYLLPLVLVLEQEMTPAGALLCFGAICAALLVTLTLLAATCTLGCTYSEVIVRGFLPRAGLGLLVFIFGLVRNERLKLLRASGPR